ncbi:putative outer membrane protein [Pedobacter sp. BAL39]|uniref:SusC/RagA family TonB-linked outer membrane protein n=1 Tax=Pedobacter sp. BAL39 TaxID=391596 RepID=UPI0001559345|nr:SusC/RagA family TonB-linked outer membrane protein [Pedobacter sp. BAL39]EDM35377.1 putative outer membrane protein [Pedobacter sp. BAL39]
MKLYAFNLGMPLLWLPPKLLLIMKISCILIFITLTQISAKTIAQKITLEKHNAHLEEILLDIKTQSGYTFLLKNLDTELPRITVSLKNSDIKNALNQVLKNTSIQFKIVEKNILLTKKNLTILDNIENKITGLISKIDVKGRVIDTLGSPLIGAIVGVKGTNKYTRTNDNGEFSLNGVNENDILTITYIGYKTQEFKATSRVSIVMIADISLLNEIQIVTTGYQTLPRERATGSFTTLDEKTLSRNVGTNILDRLDGIASGLVFNKGLAGTNNSKLSIHGRSTLFSNPEPLVVLDGFPYDGTIDQINPADIETITLLKDAAASSIWGVRSGNGVIVITTKKGTRNKKLSIGVVSTYTSADKPDLYYLPQMSSSQFINLEQTLFNNGFYNAQITEPYLPISDAIEIFNKTRLGLLSPSDSSLQIDRLKSNDFRADLSKYAYRRKSQQQYALNFSGGSIYHKFYLSGGYDKTLESKQSDSYDRITLNASNTFNFFNERLEISSDINFISSKTGTSSDNYTAFSPYDKLADEYNNHLAVTSFSTLRKSYVDTVSNGKLLDWHYRPLDELNANSTNSLNQYRIKAGFNIKIVRGLSLIANYQFLNEVTNGNRTSDLNSFYTRDLINKFSAVSNNTVTRIIPFGDYLSILKGQRSSKIIRAQLNYTKQLATEHEINLLGGYEGSDTRNQIGSQPYYGYNRETLSDANGTIDPTRFYKLYYGSGSASISTTSSSVMNVDINQSFFANGSYGFRNRYILSGSIRRDESNLFGVETNQKGIPLWSGGIAWNINKEGFYKVNWLPNLKLRMTYGLNGNFDRSTSAYLATRSVARLNSWGSRYAIITNPSNPDLRWEKIKTWNIGIDFASKNDRVTGSFDIYRKNSKDLIGNSPIAYQSGVSQYRGNSANLLTKGFDLVLNSINLEGDVQWLTSFLLNYNLDKVTKYEVKQSSNALLVPQNFNNPLEGYPYHAIFSFPYAGLNGDGKPQGYLNGVITSEISKILNVFDTGLIKYHGTASPKFFGSFINTFLYKQFELSINMTYKLGYYFRRTNVFNGSNYGSAANPNFQISGFDERWKKGGDELTTRVPALSYPANIQQGEFYLNSSDLIEKGDHIRLQDIRFSYDVGKRALSTLSIKRASLFFYARNIGIAWRANRLNIDPDYGSTVLPLPLSCSFGVNLSL